MRRPAPSTVRWGLLVALLVLWEVLPGTKIIPELFLPSLSKTLTVLWIDRAEYADAPDRHALRGRLAMLIACGAGILTGALVGGIAVLRNLMLPVFSSLYAVPIVILYPIFTAWFGIGSESKIAFAGIYGFFPVMLSTAAGIRTIDPQYLLAARSMGATLPQQITRVIIPASIPTVLTGLRLGGALTIIGVVVSEMLTSSAGIGYLVTRYRTILDSPHVFAAILMILLLSILFDLLARAVERRTLVWQTAGRRERPARAAMPRDACTGTRVIEERPWPSPCCRPPSSAPTRSPTGWSNREMLSKIVPRTRLQRDLARGRAVPRAGAGRRHPARHPRHGAGRHRHRHRRRDAARKLLQPLRHGARGHRRRAPGRDRQRRVGQKTPVPRVVGKIRRTQAGRAARHAVPARQHRPARPRSPCPAPSPWASRSRTSSTRTPRRCAWTTPRR